jgi:hypothetical protein
MQVDSGKKPSQKSKEGDEPKISFLIERGGKCPSAFENKYIFGEDAQLKKV